MPAFPPSPRLVATPLWALARAWEWAVERQRPWLEARGRRAGLTVAAIDAFARSDARGLHLVLDGGRLGGWATLEGLRAALVRARARGKLITFELARCGNAELYLASVGDRVWIHPTVEVGALGLAASLSFVGALARRLGVGFDVEAAGAYKAFGETFTRAWASAENREATRALVAGLQAHWDAAVAEGRRIAPEAVRGALADAPLSAEAAVAAGLIDGARYRDQIEAELDELYGGAPRRRLAGLARAARLRERLERWIERRPRVAVLHLDGNVVDGADAGGSVAIAVGPVCEALDALREDDRVTGVVLAIRSPGGSATASDAIWRSVRRLVETKPVVAAFGDVAASGGYYIGVACNEIVARACTVTGSIGVVGGKPVIGAALDQAGVAVEVVSERPDAAMFSALRPFTPAQRARFRASLDRFYDTFVDRVSAGRRAPRAAIEPHARGRVWTGAEAQAHGLVDRIGGVEEALARVQVLTGAAVVARVDVYVTPEAAWWQRLLRRAMRSAGVGLAGPALGAWLDDADGALAAFAEGRPMAWWPWRIDP